MRGEGASICAGVSPSLGNLKSQPLDPAKEPCIYGHTKADANIAMAKCLDVGGDRTMPVLFAIGDSKAQPLHPWSQSSIFMSVAVLLDADSYGQSENTLSPTILALVLHRCLEASALSQTDIVLLHMCLWVSGRH